MNDLNKTEKENTEAKTTEEKKDILEKSIDKICDKYEDAFKKLAE